MSSNIFYPPFDFIFIIPDSPDCKDLLSKLSQVIMKYSMYALTPNDIFIQISNITTFYKIKLNKSVDHYVGGGPGGIGGLIDGGIGGRGGGGPVGGFRALPTVLRWGIAAGSPHSTLPPLIFHF